jgi:hypothetical protein
MTESYSKRSKERIKTQRSIGADSMIGICGEFGLACAAMCLLATRQLVLLYCTVSLPEDPILDSWAKAIASLRLRDMSIEGILGVR